MALFTRGRKAAADMVRLSGLIVLSVARVTLRRESLELTYRCAFVARSTVERGVRPHKRETVLMLLDLLYGNMPALHRVTLLAGRAKLTLVNVSMAIRAFLANVGEHRFGMALGTSNTLVHAAQGKARLVVIELRNIADGLPSAHGVAVLAGNIQRAVRAPRAARGGTSASRLCGQHEPKDNLN